MGVVVAFTIDNGGQEDVHKYEVDQRAFDSAPEDALKATCNMFLRNFRLLKQEASAE